MEDTRVKVKKMELKPGNYFHTSAESIKIDNMAHPSLVKARPTSIIIPTLNEGENIAHLLLRLDQALTRAHIVYEAIVVDDHSTDDTLVNAEAAVKSGGLPVRILMKQGRPGKSFSLIEGFAAAKYDVLVMLDGDLQYPPEVIPRMIEQMEHVDILVADRRTSYYTTDRIRSFLSQIFVFTMSLLFGVNIDMQSGLKAFHRKVYKDVVLHPSKWSFDLQLVIQAINKGYSVASILIPVYARYGGKSKVRALAVGIELLREALKLKWSLMQRDMAAGFERLRQPVPSPQGDAALNTVALDSNDTEQVKYYRSWLDAEAHHKQDRVSREQEEIKTYRDYALRDVTVRGKNVTIFAPFRSKFSALRTFTPGQITAICIILAAWIMGLAFFANAVIIAAIAFFTLLYFGDLLLTFFLSLQTLSRSVEQTISDHVVASLADAEWPMYTILCPLYHEAKVVPQFVRGMQALDYPSSKLQVLFLTEENDVETREAIRALQLPGHFEIVTVPDGQPRTKPRACNYGLLRAVGDYVVIYDAEDIPDPLQLKKAVLTFARQGLDVACVQAKLNFYNPQQNLLTRWFTAEYSLWFDLTLPGLQRAKLPLPLGGTSNHFRAEILRTLGAWDAFNVTEDCDLGLRLAHYNLKTAMLDSTTYEEATSHVTNWLRQRSRWIKGYMQTYLVYMRQPQRYLQPKYFLEFISLQLIVGGKTAVLFINPVMWLLLALYIVLQPAVNTLYHTLFPAPVLYMGTLCLVFGNFFYLYSHLAGCLRRRQYDLLKWTLFIPIYWALTSVAAFIALYQVIFKPHYWEKTQHGLHTALSTAPSGISWVSNVLQSEKALPAMPVSPSHEPGRVLRRSSPGKVTLHKFAATDMLASPNSVPQMVLDEANARPTPIPSITEKIKVVRMAQKADRVRVGRLAMQLPKRAPAWRQVFRDTWLLATLLTACCASIVSLLYFFQTHQILLDGDSYSHMLIARRLFDSATPGLAQLGGVWLPLPHLLMLPFIWNDYLWRTGLAGSIPSMICYVIATAYLFLAARRLTGDDRACFVGTLLFILNPNILYLQVTPLSELVLIATLTMACYHFIVWTQDNSAKQLIWTAAATFLATLARYDGWFLFLAFFVLVVLISWIRYRRWTFIEGNLLIFSILGGLGIALWLLWCEVIFGDPLYFQRGPFSAQAQQKEWLRVHLLHTYHDLWQAFRYYTIASIDTLGPLLFGLSVIGVVVFVVRRRVSLDMLAALTFLVPFIFYVTSLFGGQAALFLPQAVPAHAPYSLFNARYGAMIVAPAAIFVSTLVSRWVMVTRRWALRGLRTGGQVACVVVILVQTALTIQGGIITLQDGQYGLACDPPHPVVAYLAQHYAGGRILEDLYTSKISQPEAGVDFKNIIYEGSGELWQRALHDPASMDWIIINTNDTTDLIATHIDVKSAAFQSLFTLVVREPTGIIMFHRNGQPPLPTRPAPDGLLSVHSRCGGAGSYAYGGTDHAVLALLTVGKAGQL